MTKRLRRGLTVPAALATLAAAGAAAAPASAAGYNGACGTGYTVIDSRSLGDATTVFLTWNRATGKNCVVHQITTDNGGWPWLIGAWVQRTADDRKSQDHGEYTRYAGPVYVNGRGTCINWGGRLGSDPSQHNVAEYASHCG
ncbi:spore-associated protein A [Streptomyces sp. NPDC002054]|uniref:spore-associated protein A n=1 Tax=Streptomyces sp. NPDC002054 TaxID=3154663 RepID=UPI0033181FD3